MKISDVLRYSAAREKDMVLDEKENVHSRDGRSPCTNIPRWLRRRAAPRSIGSVSWTFEEGDS